MLLERTSTASLHNTLLGSTRRLQVSLQNAQVEVSTKRHADVGLVLGGKTGRNLSWRNEIASLEARITRNEFSLGRADVSQKSIEAIKALSEKLRESAMGARSAQNGAELAKVSGENALSGILDITSTSYAGEHIFSGRSPEATPIRSYEGMPAQAAFDSAFLAEFGFAKSSPLAASITPSQMQVFLDGRFSDLFEDPAWSADWSQSSNENIAARIDENTNVDIDANANEMAFRQAIKASVALYEFGGMEIGQGTLQTVTDVANRSLSESIRSLGDIQSRIGYAQQATKQATERQARKKDLLEQAVVRTEGVSEFESATRLNALMTQLESSYAVTARISKLSLLNYI